MASRSQCRKALQLHETSLSGRKNVVGLGIVPLDEEANDKQLAVAVYVAKKVPLEKLKRDQIVPETLAVPGRDGVIEVPTKVIEQGPVELEAMERA
jgi:hypothetical protein